MGFFKDAVAVFKKRECLFIESKKEAEDVYSFLFEKGPDLTWHAGQHGLFHITHKKVKNSPHPFTVASAPAENVIRITTVIKDNPSEFKKAMLDLKQGMSMSLSGPLGSFHLSEQAPTLFIAGGIGITPFRSMIKQLEAEGSGVEGPIQLLYMDSKKHYIFREELDAIADKISLSISYLDSRETLQQEIDQFVANYQNNGRYFIAGPKSLADSLSAYLQSKKIAKRNLKKDGFFGY